MVPSSWWPRAIHVMAGVMQASVWAQGVVHSACSASSLGPTRPAQALELPPCSPACPVFLAPEVPTLL